MIADNKEIEILKEAYIYYHARGHDGVLKILLDNGVSEKRARELIRNERQITDDKLNSVVLIKIRNGSFSIGDYFDIKVIILSVLAFAIWAGIKILLRSPPQGNIQIQSP